MPLGVLEHCSSSTHSPMTSPSRGILTISPSTVFSLYIDVHRGCLLELFSRNCFVFMELFRETQLFSLTCQNVQFAAIRRNSFQQCLGSSQTVNCTPLRRYWALVGSRTWSRSTYPARCKQSGRSKGLSP